MSRTRRSDSPGATCHESHVCHVGPPPGDADLFARCRDGDGDAREQLVERFAPLAARLARRYQHSGEPLDDLEQVALIGLIKAVDSFDPARGTAFGGYAMPAILGEIRHYFRDHTWVLHVPGRMRELTLRVSATTIALSEQLKREPSVLEIAQAIGATDEEVLDARQASRARRALSFAESRVATRDGDATTLGDAITIDDDGFLRAEDRAQLESLLRTLSPRQQVVLRLRFQHDMTQTEIARLVGVSQVHVSRILRQALELMRSSDEHAGRARSAAPSGALGRSAANAA